MSEIVEFIDNRPPVATAPPRVWPSLLMPFAAVFGILALQILFGIALGIAMSIQGVPPPQMQSRMMEMFASPFVFMMILLTGQVAFLIAALLGGWLSPEPLCEREDGRRS